MTRARKKQGEKRPRVGTLEEKCPTEKTKARGGKRNILKFPPHQGNGQGLYIPYCSHQRIHPGFIKDDQTCREKDCTYYKKIYLNDL